MTDPRGPALPPPGWHPDPTGRHELRYWDGARWSEHVSDRGQVGADDLAPVPPQPTRTEPNRTETAVSTATAASAGPPAEQIVRGAPPGALGAPPPSVPATAGGVVTPPVPVPTRPAPTGAPPTMMRSVGGLAASLTVVLWVAVALAVFGAFAFANRVVVTGDILDFDFGRGRFDEIFDLQQRADDADDLVGVAVVLMVLCSLVIFVLLLVWMWRVAKNAQLAGRHRPRFGPGWTIGGWFIPLANLVIPVLVMQDLWRGSDPSVARDDPAWRRAGGSALVGWWWAAHILAALRFGGGTEAESRDELEALRAYDVAAAVGMLAAVAAAVLLISVVRRITRRQEALFTGLPVTPA